MSDKEQVYKAWKPLADALKMEVSEIYSYFIQKRQQDGINIRAFMRKCGMTDEQIEDYLQWSRLIK